MPAPRTGARRPPPRSSARRSGPNPVILASGLGILILLVGIAFALHSRNKAREARNNQPVEKTFDPNAEIEELEADFAKLRNQTRKVLSRRNSQYYERNVAVLKKKWTLWLSRYDEVFREVKNPDGSWPPKYQRYARLRGEAQQFKLDVIKMGGF